jgi:phosphoglycolate phosphatase
MIRGGSTLTDIQIKSAAELVAGLDLLIFDFDGTLADSEDLLIGLVLRTLEEVGLRPAVAPPDIGRLIGLPLVEVLAVASGTPADQLREVALHYRRIADSPGSSPFPPFQACARRSRPWRRAVTVGDRHEQSRAITERILPPSRSTTGAHRRGGDYVRHGKPHPKRSAGARRGGRAARRMASSRHHHDIGMGKRAGVTTIAATYGCDRATLSALAPDAFVPTSPARRRADNGQRRRRGDC